MYTVKYRRLSSEGAPDMPGGGSAINRSVSLRIRRGRAAMMERTRAKERDRNRNRGERETWRSSKGKG